MTNEKRNEIIQNIKMLIKDVNIDIGDQLEIHRLLNKNIR